MAAFSISFAILGCNDNSNVDRDVNIDSSINKLTTQKVTLNSVELNSDAYTEHADFFLAPLTVYSTLGNKKDDTVSEINNDGFNYHVITNVFETYLIL